MFVPDGLQVSYDKKTQSKTYTYTSYKKIEKQAFMQSKVERNPPVLICKNIKDEVFFGPDIVPGIALTLLQHLRAADPSGTFINTVLQKDFKKQVAALIAGIWIMIEAKVPGTFQYYTYSISKGEAQGSQELGTKSQKTRQEFGEQFTKLEDEYF